MESAGVLNWGERQVPDRPTLRDRPMLLDRALKDERPAESICILLLSSPVELLCFQKGPERAIWTAVPPSSLWMSSLSLELRLGSKAVREWLGVQLQLVSRKHPMKSKVLRSLNRAFSASTASSSRPMTQPGRTPWAVSSTLSFRRSPRNFKVTASGGTPSFSLIRLCVSCTELSGATVSGCMFIGLLLSLVRTSKKTRMITMDHKASRRASNPRATHVQPAGAARGEA
mmetsp:Transcript_15809/g.26163  ORF Transcript_15809/g.26163 Transcript_15809/m.26163 type:complete len:229 (+) Transcript_15809:83-769(+)